MLEGFPSLASAGHARMHIGVRLPESNRRAALVRLLLEGFSSMDAHIIMLEEVTYVGRGMLEEVTTPAYH